MLLTSDRGEELYDPGGWTLHLGRAPTALYDLLRDPRALSYF